MASLPDDPPPIAVESSTEEEEDDPPLPDEPLMVDDAPSEFARPHLAMKMKRATVKIILNRVVFTGTIVGGRANKTLVLTVAHTVTDAAGWMQIEELQKSMMVQFYRSYQLFPCIIRVLEMRSDIMMLEVDRETPDDHKLDLAPEEEWELVESQVLGARGHPQGQHQWTLVDGAVCTPNLQNKDFFRVFPDYKKSLKFFEHRLDLGMGCSGAALVNLNGNIVGMQLGMPTCKFNVLVADKMTNAVSERKMQLVGEFNNIKDDLDPAALATAEKDLEVMLKEGVSLGNSQYGPEDAVIIKQPLSQIKWAIHVEFIKSRIQLKYHPNKSLEDIYFP